AAFSLSSRAHSSRGRPGSPGPPHGSLYNVPRPPLADYSSAHTDRPPATGRVRRHLPGGPPSEKRSWCSLPRVALPLQQFPLLLVQHHLLHIEPDLRPLNFPFPRFKLALAIHIPFPQQPFPHGPSPPR